MQDWRFDDLTRTLGTATTRRGVLKGLLAGVAAALVGRSIVEPSQVAAASCDHRDCEKRAAQFFVNCLKSTRLFGGGSRPGGSIPPSARNRTLCGLAMFAQLESCRQSGCLAEEVCCNGGCADLLRDPSNCGSCGHTCPSGATCYDGECQCPDNLTKCVEQCIDTQSDNNNCGDCGHVCGSCEVCLGGECTSICSHDEVCCDDTCVSAQCPSPKVFDSTSCSCQCPPVNCPAGEVQDSDTCQCGCSVGVICGSACCSSGEVCCNEQCVSNQCPSPKVFDDQVCGCVCPPANCGFGQLQDPDTCQCIDLCANVTCATCQTCDPTSGTCVQVADQTSCGNGQVCCTGTCQDTCGTCAGLPCANGDCCTNSTDFACCEDGCCPQVTINGQTNAYCVAAGTSTGPLGNPVGNCCAPADLIKLSVIDPTTNQCGCGSGSAFQVACAGNLPPDAFGITYCSCGPWF